MILDGEAVMFDDQGRSDFNLLQASLGANGKAQGCLVSPAVMMAFDLLYFDGHDLAPRAARWELTRPDRRVLGVRRYGPWEIEKSAWFALTSSLVGQISSLQFKDIPVRRRFLQPLWSRRP
jgi:hypothetical protein